MCSAQGGARSAVCGYAGWGHLGMHLGLGGVLWLWGLAARCSRTLCSICLLAAQFGLVSSRLDLRAATLCAMCRCIWTGDLTGIDDRLTGIDDRQVSATVTSYSSVVVCWGYRYTILGAGGAIRWPGHVLCFPRLLPRDTNVPNVLVPSGTFLRQHNCVQLVRAQSHREKTSVDDPGLDTMDMFARRTETSCTRTLHGMCGHIREHASHSRNPCIARIWRNPF